ncbi:hypothetical protein [Bacillus sp. MZGC1]|uniref:hypothetical protein n=1 Tax=Bacillus sp. MZGC1 TaxID=2108543 RepID=UPI000D02E33E|nr:hypothetical protein [Bacillus sp. MZGC1]PRS47529.1 hypothetical protein C6Y06_18435 [Bacillus sp. MZGC1]
MQSITKITWDNKLQIDEAFEITDKGFYYRSNFRKSRFELIPKKTLSDPKPFVEFGTWRNTLYISTNKFKKNKDFWIDMVKKYRTSNDGRKWLK